MKLLKVTNPVLQVGFQLPVSAFGTASDPDAVVAVISDRKVAKLKAHWKVSRLKVCDNTCEELES